jgi:5'-3' exonuclease
VPWLLYRAFFALPSSIRGAGGQPVNALLGTVNALLGAAEACGPRAVVACMGAEQAAYRVKLYPAYHAHREPMPDALAEQWVKAPGLLARFGWMVDASERYEADDVMFSHAALESRAGGRALLLTGDRDLYGAVGARVAILEPVRRGRPGALVGPAQVRERCGVEPVLIPDLIALRGDPSDGLPGAPGIGAKTAAELLRRHGSLENTIAAARLTLSAGGKALAAGARTARGGAGAPGATGSAGAPSAGPAMSRRVASALVESADVLGAFKRIATLQRLHVERAADRATDRAAGALAARELGMNALARRLERGAREDASGAVR